MNPEVKLTKKQTIFYHDQPARSAQANLGKQIC